MIDAGNLRHRVVFECFTGNTDEFGGAMDYDDTEWSLFRSCYAAIDPTSGREFYEAHQSQSEVTHKIRCRYFAGLKPSMRIRYGERIFKIISVIDWEERHESFLIMAKELVR